MSFGQTFRNAREAKGLTPSKVAAQTRILVQIITDMENEDFHRIPAPIYGRGFVRLYAECVGLDPAPLIHEFMEIYEGRQPPASAQPASTLPPIYDEPIQTPLPEPVPAPVSAPLPDPAEDPPPRTMIDPVIPAPFTSPAPTFAPTLDEIPPPVKPFPPMPEEPTPPAEPAPIAPLWDPPPPTSAPTLPTPATEPPEPEPQPAVVRGLDLFEQPPVAAPERPTPKPSSGLPPQIDVSSPYLTSSSYDDTDVSAADRFRESISALFANIIHRVEDIPRRTWRLALLALGSLVVLAVLVFGCIKLYQMTSRLPAAPGAQGASDVETSPRPEAVKPIPPAPSASKAKPRNATKPQATGKTAASAKPASATRPATPGKIRSTGQKVPSLYMD